MSPNTLVENLPFLSEPTVNVDALRLDKIHPIVSGNKWYKLRFYIEAAIQGNYTQIASFGGPFSNHLVALAYAAQENGLESIGYVRSNDGEPLTPSLKDAVNFGMKLIYLGRSSFQVNKYALIHNQKKDPKIYYVDEGGYGKLGAKGASTIIQKLTNGEEVNYFSDYDYIVCAVGTGTMIAGIINAASSTQQIIGIPVLKNEESINKEIEALLNNPKSPYTLLHSYHQGGYAKTTEPQINFMNALWQHDKIPTDIVYTGKVFFAVQQLVKMNYFKPNTRVLVIHSGGLQGNRSLGEGVLEY